MSKKTLAKAAAGSQSISSFFAKKPAAPAAAPLAEAAPSGSRASDALVVAGSDDDDEPDDDVPQISLNPNPAAGEPLITLHRDLARHCKPHQAEGLRFMFHALTGGGVTRLKKGSRGSGCLLAHCMGLGKTFQTIALIHTLITHPRLFTFSEVRDGVRVEELSEAPTQKQKQAPPKELKRVVRTVLVLCPLTVLRNWEQELRRWLPPAAAMRGSTSDGAGAGGGAAPPAEVGIFCLDERRKRPSERVQTLSSWRRQGGVLLCGYDMFVALTQGGGGGGDAGGGSGGLAKAHREIAFAALLWPGPDVLVADEAHILGNAGAKLTQALKLVTTRRRLALTGSPLRNNLDEFFVLLDFARRNAVASSAKAFRELFATPIAAGQFGDSSPAAVALAKRRAFVLLRRTRKFVQRRDASTLAAAPDGPPGKTEVVVCLSSSPEQRREQRRILEAESASPSFSSSSSSSSSSNSSNSFLWGASEGGVTARALFRAYQKLLRVWNHPDIADLGGAESSGEGSEAKKAKQAVTYSGGDGFGDFGFAPPPPQSSSSSSSSSSMESTAMSAAESQAEAKRRGGGGGGGGGVGGNGAGTADLIRRSAKVVWLLELCAEAARRGEKVLVFSQSLVTLSFLEGVLASPDWGAVIGSDPPPPSAQQPHWGSWVLDREVLRLDGSTPATVRHTLIRRFNAPPPAQVLAPSSSSSFPSSFSSPPSPHVFLISTKAGGLGCNLTAANHVVLFDTSWNPAVDLQAIYRCYRFGQRRHVYCYRLLLAQTLEERIYSRQVAKQGLASQVVDDTQLERVFNQDEVAALLDEVQKDTSSSLRKGGDRFGDEGADGLDEVADWGGACNGSLKQQQAGIVGAAAARKAPSAAAATAAIARMERAKAAAAAAATATAVTTIDDLEATHATLDSRNAALPAASQTSLFPPPIPPPHVGNDGRSVLETVLSSRVAGPLTFSWVSHEALLEDSPEEELSDRDRSFAEAEFDRDAKREAGLLIDSQPSSSSAPRVPAHNPQHRQHSGAGWQYRHNFAKQQQRQHRHHAAMLPTTFAVSTQAELSSSSSSSLMGAPSAERTHPDNIMASMQNARILAGARVALEQRRKALTALSSSDHQKRQLDSSHKPIGSVGGSGGGVPVPSGAGSGVQQKRQRVNPTPTHASATSKSIAGGKRGLAAIQAAKRETQRK